MRSVVSDTIAHEAQAFVGTGGHGQGEGLTVDAEMAQLALPADLGDFNAVRGKETDDFLIAGVAAHAGKHRLAEGETRNLETRRGVL